jgi:hypothetical protein
VRAAAGVEARPQRAGGQRPGRSGGGCAVFGSVDLSLVRKRKAGVRVHFFYKSTTSVGHPLADRSYVNFRWLAPTDGNYVISVSFPSSR